MSSGSSDTPSFGDFRASRDEALTRRMRSARATGNVPTWQVMDVVYATEETTTIATTSPTGAHDAPPHDHEDAKKAAPAHSTIEPWALASALVAFLVIVALLGALMMHRTKYGRTE